MNAPSPQSNGVRGAIHLLRSPTIIITITLLVMYLVTGWLTGDYFAPVTIQTINNSLALKLLVQCDGPTPVVPWTVLTSIFLHASVVHIVGNLLFLLFFGFILEEQVTKNQWLTTFFASGIIGGLSFVALDVTSNVLSGSPGPSNLDCAVGASGAIYGIMGASVGLKVVILLIFLFGLNIFAGGGTPAHLGGLVAGLVLRKYWSLGNRPFKGI